MLPWSHNRELHRAKAGGFRLVCCGRCRSAHAQPWADNGIDRQQAYDEREGEPERCGEKTVHACAPMAAEPTLSLLITQRTVKSHQSRNLKTILVPVVGRACDEDTSAVIACFQAMARVKAGLYIELGRIANVT